MSKTLSVYEPPLCCATGVCGATVDPVLVNFAADLDWLRSQGVEVSRYNLSQQPGAFVDQPLVRAAMQEDGEKVLPLVLVDGEVRTTARYPAREELGSWFGLGDPAPAKSQSSGGCCGPSGCC